MTTRILIVEDDPDVSSMLELTFAVDGFATEVASDGGQAVARLAGEPPDLVLLDVMMPEVDGFGVLKQLRKVPAWGEVPVVILSARRTDQDLWAGWSSGADYYLPKPFDVDELRAVVLRLLAGTPTP